MKRAPTASWIIRLGLAVVLVVIALVAALPALELANTGTNEPQRDQRCLWRG